MTHLWTPWRSTYMQEKRDKGRCVFCDAAAGSDDKETLVVYRGQHNFVILNRYPYTSGHLMIVPNGHVSRLSASTPESSEEMMSLARDAERILENVYKPDGINIGMNLGMNLGEAAGAGIEQHIHMHVLPRWIGDANFMTSVGGTRIIPESLNDTYTKMKSAFSDASPSSER